eukprot:CAMPEP_0180431860 /NCGR_PEP_ID=MMETSP1036_2-20121128/8618_1 /TAXON_ID=632150 /ORGANISM="Azadinium spinosum, Strain 3D9" /LENGTH=653 /DNA_ID=CAMNT_0022437637 /DNA_START=1 /DNA_END=1958 /DNA_ORIENTATION=+
MHCGGIHGVTVAAAVRGAAAAAPCGATAPRPAEVAVAMVLLTRARSQDPGTGRAGAGTGGQEITTGCRVVVLNGRHFSAFGAGDEGVVRRVDPEAQNCEVLFDGRAQPVQVALRHLRVAPGGAAVAVAAPGACAAGDGVCGHAVAAPLEDASLSPRDVSCEQWSTLTSLLKAPEASTVAEPCEYMDSAAGFRAGLAAVSNTVVSGGARDMKHGMPSILPQAHTVAHPVAMPVLEANLAPVPMVTMPGGAHLANGCAGAAAGVEALPGQQGCESACTNGARMAPSEHLSYSTASDMTQWGVSSVAFGPGPGLGMTTSYQATSSNAIGDADVLAAAPDGRTGRLEALETRLANVEEEHRMEVESLRHALEECVRAIGTCARAIDAMCASDGGDVPSGQWGPALSARGTPGTSGDWRGAAAALHDAASLGMRALGSACVPYSCGPAVGPQHSHGASPCPLASASLQGPGGGRASITAPSAAAMGVEVMGGAVADSIGGAGTPSVTRQNSFAGPGQQSAAEASRRFLVAAPSRGGAGTPGGQPFPLPQQPPFSLALGGLTGTVGGAGGAPGAAAAPLPPCMANMGSAPMISGWGSASAPEGGSFSQRPQHLAPPGNLLGSIPGLTLFPGLPGSVVGPTGALTARGPGQAGPSGHPYA